MWKKDSKQVVVCVENAEKRGRLKEMLRIISDKGDFYYRDTLQKLREDPKLFRYDYVVLGQAQGSDFFSREVLIGGQDNCDECELFMEIKRRLSGGISQQVKRVMTFSELSEKYLKMVEENIRNDIVYKDEDILELIDRVLANADDVGKNDKERLKVKIFNTIRRYDVLTEFLEDNEITEIMVNGTDNIFVEKNFEIIKVDKCFDSKDRLRNIINKMVNDAGRQIDEANPIVDARLADGSRVNAVLEPIAINGPSLTIRRFPKAFTMEDLVENETLSSGAASMLSDLVKAKYNIFVSGSTGSGKTTLLNCLSEFISEKERIITIEDSAELQIRHIPNIIKMEVRLANSNGKGGITISDLIKNSLRMRPDRIIVGEVRREEAYDMLQAMNTGHDGSLSTGHANSGSDMMRRLETMILTNSSIPLEAVRGTIESAIDIVVHLSRTRSNQRKVVEICEVDGFNEDGSIRLVPIYEYDDKVNRLVVKNKLKNVKKLEIAGLIKNRQEDVA